MAIWGGFSPILAPAALAVTYTSVADDTIACSDNTVLSISRIKWMDDSSVVTDAAANSYWQYDQSLVPDAITGRCGLSGAVTAIDEVVDSPDANWLLAA